MDTDGAIDVIGDIAVFGGMRWLKLKIFVRKSSIFPLPPHLRINMHTKLIYIFIIIGLVMGPGQGPY